jgi:uncharacterized RDD family membrane protein YckC
MMADGVAAARLPSTIPAGARPYQGHRAGVVTRFAASTLDFVVVLGIIGVIYGGIIGIAFLVNPRNFSWPSRLGWSVPVVAFVIAVPYLTLWWTTTGRTIGDSLLGLRVVGRHGHRLGVGIAVIRALLYVLFPIGLFWVAVSRSNRSIQDLVLRTSVVYAWTPRVASIDSAADELPQPDRPSPP